jgi:uncharacterized protein
MLGAAEDIVRRGGQRGIGCCMITQRSAVLNKNVLTQIQVLIVLRTIAPQDLKALDAWVEVHGTPEQRKILMDSLPALPVGDAWVWSPGWPTEDGIFKRVHVLPIETFDSGATPKPGQRRAEPRKQAQIDLAALERQMAATIEKAKADDPKLLRQQIAELKRELASAAKKGTDPQAIRAAEARGRAAAEREARQVIADREGRLQKIERIAHLNAEALPVAERDTKITKTASGGRVAPAGNIRGETAARPLPKATAAPVSNNDFDLGKGGARRMLIALAQHSDGMGIQKLGILVGMKTSGGSFGTYLSRLKGAGYIDGGRNHLLATTAGVAALGAYQPLPTGAALVEYWRGELPGGMRRIFDAIVGAYPRALLKEQIAEAVEMQVTGGSFGTYLSRLRTLNLVEGKAELRASATLFE